MYTKYQQNSLIIDSRFLSTQNKPSTVLLLLLHKLSIFLMKYHPEVVLLTLMYTKWRLKIDYTARQNASFRFPVLNIKLEGKQKSKELTSAVKYSRIAAL